MPFQEIFDETLDINSTENYQISVELSTGNLTFCVLDTIRNKFIMLRSYSPENNHKYSSEEINEIISKDDFLTKKYKKVNVILPSQKFTLIPAPLFDPARKDEYFSFNHVQPENNLIYNNKLTDPDSFLVFTVSKQLSDLVKIFWPGSYPYHHLKPLFEYFNRDKRDFGENYIHVHIENDFFNLVIFNNKNLKFCNSFNYRNVSDILYYILNIFKSMNIRQEETIIMSGQTERYDDLFSNLALYIRNLKFAEPTGDFTFSYVFNDIGLQKFINLISVVNCA
jgi:hypothetical protein